MIINDSGSNINTTTSETNHRVADRIHRHQESVLHHETQIERLRQQKQELIAKLLDLINDELINQLESMGIDTYHAAETLIKTGRYRKKLKFGETGTSVVQAKETFAAVRHRWRDIVNVTLRFDKTSATTNHNNHALSFSLK